MTFSQQLLRSIGLPQQDSLLVATLLLNADLQGYSGHGIFQIPTYVSRIKKGQICLDAPPQVIREGMTSAVIDGNHYIGQVVAYEGMNLAIAKAKEHGVGVVTIFRSGHVGRLADYVQLSADQGMIGMAAVSITSATNAPYGSIDPVTGTNPMAFGIPASKGQHLIFDFATSAASIKKLQKMVVRRENIPEGLMIDNEGRPTTSYKVFYGPPRGAILPFGGYKGSGLNLVAEILGGILSGNGLGIELWEKGGGIFNGLFLLAISITEFQPLHSFLGKMDKLIALTKSRRLAPGFKEILIPGEGSRKKAQKHLQDGIEIDPATWTELQQCATDLGVEVRPAPLEQSDTVQHLELYP